MEEEIRTKNSIETSHSLETTHTLDFSDKLYKVVIGVIVVASIFLVGELMYRFSSLPKNMPHEISISGEGKAYIKPDIALINFGVSSQALKSQDVVNQNNTKMNAVIKAIKDLGVEDKDIQTTLYSLTPLYEYPAAMGVPSAIRSDSIKLESSAMTYPSFFPVKDGRVFNGYHLEQQVSVKIRNFDNINSVLDKAAEAGATNIGELQFTVDDSEKVRSDARAKAIENAKEKLKDITKQSGLKIGKLVNIYEGYNNYPQPIYGKAMGGAEDSTIVAPEIQTGQMEVSVNVTLTYQVK